MVVLFSPHVCYRIIIYLQRWRSPSIFNLIGNGRRIEFGRRTHIDDIMYITLERKGKGRDVNGEWSNEFLCICKMRAAMPYRYIT